MQIAIIETGQLVTREQLEAAYSGVEITTITDPETGDETQVPNHYELCLPRDLTGTDLSSYGAAPVLPSDPPEAPEGQIAVIDGAEDVDGVWRWKWKLEDAPPPPVPFSVSPLEIRKALRKVGLMAQVKDYLENHATEEAIEEWDFATSIDRDNATLTAAATALGLTSSALDDLFVLAASLTASAAGPVPEQIDT